MKSPSGAPTEAFRKIYTIHSNGISLTATHYSIDGEEFLGWTGADGRSSIILKKSDDPDEFAAALAQVKKQEMPTR